MERFTPEMIASMVEQVRKSPKISISEIRDEGDAIRVLGTAKIDYMPVDRDAVQTDDGVYGTVLYLRKA